MNSLNRVNYSNAMPYTGANSSSSTTGLSEEELFEKDLKDWEEESTGPIRDQYDKNVRCALAGDIRRAKNLSDAENIRISAGLFLWSLPRCLFSLTHLANLSLRRNHFESLPEEIGLLTNLKHLNLSDNLLKELPRTIGKLTKLIIFNLCQNQLETVPREIGCLVNLTHLDIHLNPLKTLPPEISRLTNLEDFALPTDLKPLLDEDKQAEFERNGIIVDHPYPPYGKKVTDVVTFMKNTKGFVDVEELFGDIKNAAETL